MNKPIHNFAGAIIQEFENQKITMPIALRTAQICWEGGEAERSYNQAGYIEEILL